MAKLPELCEIQYGYAFDSACFTENNTYLPLVRIRDVKRGYSETFYSGSYSCEYIIDNGSLLIGMDGEFNIARWRGGRALLNQRVCKVTAKENVNEEYIRFALSKALKEIENRTAFATVKHLSAKELNQLEIDVPNYATQTDISKVLTKIESMVSAHQQQLQKLDELVKSRFIELFGDVICNSKSWEMRVFADITSSRLGKMLDTKQQTGKCSYPYLANFNVQWFRFNTENLNQMDFNAEDRIEFELLDGDLLVCEGGEIGRCAVWHNEIQPCFFQKALHRVRCNRQVVHPDYLAWWFKYNCDHDGFAAITGAKATIAHLPGVKLKQLRVAIPPLKLQEQFATFVEQVDKSKVVAQKALDKAKLLFNSLMQKYFG